MNFTFPTTVNQYLVPVSLHVAASHPCCTVYTGVVPRGLGFEVKDIISNISAFIVRHLSTFVMCFCVLTSSKMFPTVFKPSEVCNLPLSALKTVFYFHSPTNEFCLRGVMTNVSRRLPLLCTRRQSDQ